MAAIYHCAEYAEGIFTYLREKETSVNAKDGFLKAQPEVNDRLRAGLIDWFIDTHNRFKMEEETLFLTVNIFDRFLEKERITKQKLQLVGAAAMLLAAKYEEIYPPHLKEFMYAPERPVSRDEITRMELTILQTLQFDLSVPTVLRFLERYSKLLKADETAFNLALYLAESQMLDSRMAKYTPSMIAAGSLYMAQKALRRGCAFNELLAKQAHYTEAEVQLCAKEIQATMKSKDRVGFTAARRKYSSPSHKEVSKISIDASFAS